MSDGGKVPWKWWRIDAAAVALCVLVTVAVYLMMVQPLAERNAAYAEQQQELEQARQEESVLAQRLSGQRLDLAGVNAALLETPLQLSDSSTMNKRLSDLTELAHSSRLKIDQIQPGKAQQGGRYDVVPIRLVGQGTYPSAAAFLNKMHQRFKDTGLASLELSADPTTFSTPASFIFELLWYTSPAEDL